MTGKNTVGNILKAFFSLIRFSLYLYVNNSSKDNLSKDNSSNSMDGNNWKNMESKNWKILFNSLIRTIRLSLFVSILFFSMHMIERQLATELLVNYIT